MDVDDLESLSAVVYSSADPARADELRVAADAVERGQVDEARFAAVRGGAYLVVSKLSVARYDLDRAIEWLTVAVDVGSTPSRCANLASALLERCDLDGDPRDHERALGLLRTALSDPGCSDSSHAARTISLLGAYVDGVERGYGDTPLENVIEYGEAAVTRHPGAHSGEAENLLGAAYMLAAQRGHPGADLARMVDLLETAHARLPEHHPDRPARESNLGAALLDRYEITGREEDLSRAVSLLGQAFRGFPGHHPSKPLALNNYVNAVLADYERRGDVASLAQALPLLDVLVGAFAEGHPLRPVALANAGLVARQAAHALERPELTDSAVEYHTGAVEATAEHSPLLSGRVASLALALADRYARDGDPEDLAAAIVHGTRSLGSSASHDVELSGFAVNVGNFLHERHLLHGRMSDLRAAVDLHAKGLRGVPDEHHDRAGILNNAGIVRLELYDRLGDTSDLDQAAACIAESVKTSRETDPERASRLINLAAVLHRQAALGHTHERLAEAETLAKHAAAIAGRAKLESAAHATLVDIQRDRWRQSGDQADLDRLLELDALVEPRTPAGHMRRGICRGLARDRDDEQRHLLVALESGVVSRPAVAIGAAQLLADHGLRALAAGDEGALQLVERAAAGAISARDRLVGTGEGRQADLSWHRDLTGLGALWAHARWLSGDTEGALDAFDETRSVLLSSHFPAASPVTATLVALWGSPVGGAAVLVRPGEAPTSIPLPHLTSAAAARLADRLGTAALLGHRSLDPVLSAAATRLGRLIAGPLAERLEPGEPVVCVPGGPLALLPIGLGTVAGRPLLARNPWTYALHRRAAGWAYHASGPVDLDNVVSIASPKPSRFPVMPAAVRESAEFASPDRRRHGRDATAGAVLDAFGSAAVVHVATHVGSPGDPLAQHFVLADDTPLFADEILDAAPLTSRLAVLSGCASGRTTTAHVDEGLTLASVVHAAGVPGVISSLWSVVDIPAARLMRQVVRNLRDGRTPSDALRSAQLTAIDVGRGAADWAAFTLLGR